MINKTNYAILEIRGWSPTETSIIYTAYQQVDGKYYPQRSSFSWALGEDFQQFPRVFNIFFYVTDVVTDPREIKAYRKGRRLVGAEPMSELKIRDDPAFWNGEERLLQLPADETLKFELRNLLQLPEERRDTVSRDSSK